MPAAVGVSSEMTALAQPNQVPVPGGALRMVQSWTWVKDAAPAMPAMASRMRTWTVVARCGRSRVTGSHRPSAAGRPGG